MKEKLLIIAGPTAVGKTSISVELAKRLDGEIISADSMQIYRNLDIGTAKISEEEMSGIKHHMIDIINPEGTFNVARYSELTKKLIADIHQRGSLPMVVGGTGLYINSLVYKLDFHKTAENSKFREKMQALAEEKGRDYVFSLLMEKDEKTALSLDPNNLNRVIRALEIEEYGKKKENDNFRKCNDDYNLAYICLDMKRESLYERINKRVDIMVENGLFQEVKSFLNKGLSKDSQSMKAIGYKEVIKYYDGIYSYEETINLIKQHSRNYAKRQLTWFRRDYRIKWFNIDDYNNKEDILQDILKYSYKKFSEG